MKNAKRISIALFSLIIYAGFAMAQNPIIYPAKGQSNEKMEQDKFQCYGWAKESSGHDPMQAAPSSQQSNESGGVIRGGAKGAAGGAIIGAIAGDAGKLVDDYYRPKLIITYLHGRIQFQNAILYKNA